MRSEGDAFRQTMIAAVVIAIALVVGWLTTPLAGVAIVAAALIAALVVYLRSAGRDRPAPLRDAAHTPHPHGPREGARHVLVIANEPLSGSALREQILAGDGGDVEVDVLAPVLTSHLHLGVSDFDRELDQARDRLARSLAWAQEQGIAARGRVGDPSTTTAIADELRDFGADEVIVVTHARDRETWQERGELERLRRELDVPVVHITASGGRTAPPAG